MLFANGHIRSKQTPLSPHEFFEQNPPQPNFAARNTADWRGCVASWEIRDDQLYLTGLSVVFFEALNLGRDLQKHVMRAKLKRI